jgi:hypothetical protein
MAAFFKNIVSREKSGTGASLASVAVISIGEMGLGVAKLLSNHRYRVLTNIEGRRWELAVPCEATVLTMVVKIHTSVQSLPQ